jgi:hypothetical protein
LSSSTKTSSLLGKAFFGRKEFMGTRAHQQKLNPGWSLFQGRQNKPARSQSQRWRGSKFLQSEDVPSLECPKTKITVRDPAGCRSALTEKHI